MSPQAYTVESAQHVRSKPVDGKGTFHIYSVKFREVERVAEWFSKQEQPPKQGEQLFGEITNGKFGPQFKRAQQQQQGGFRPMDPDRERRIVRQHSQHMALKYCELQGFRSKLPDDFDLSHVWKIADAFDRDVDGSAVDGAADRSAGGW